jgi:predicted RNase H-like HicB family nuclease
MTTFTAYIEFDEETKLYVGIVPGVPDAHTQAASLDELRDNLREVLELCLEGQGELRAQPPKFVGGAADRGRLSGAPHPGRSARDEPRAERPRLRTHTPEGQPRLPPPP